MAERERQWATTRALIDVARAWRLWRAAEAAMPKCRYEEAAPIARSRLLEAHGRLREVLDGAVEICERG